MLWAFTCRPFLAASGDIAIRNGLLLKSCGHHIYMCMTISDSLGHCWHLLQDFVDYSAPALLPVFRSATGESLRMLTASSPALSKVMPRALVTSMLIPLLAKAADEGRCAAWGSQSQLQSDCLRVLLKRSSAQLLPAAAVQCA